MVDPDRPECYLLVARQHLETVPFLYVIPAVKPTHHEACSFEFGRVFEESKRPILDVGDAMHLTNPPLATEDP